MTTLTGLLAAEHTSRIALDRKGQVARFHGTGHLANLFGENAVFLLSKR